MSPVLEIKNLTVKLKRAGRDISIVDDLNLTVSAGDMVGLVGESGSGKTVAALSIIRLLPPGAIITGEILLNGVDLVKLNDAQMRGVRGKGVGMVFQNPLAALNPCHTVAKQIGEAWLVHNPGTKAQARQKALELLEAVGIPNPQTRLDSYPHQFSGGMRQRVMIACALACSPSLLIADEPTTGLDPLIAKQIMELISKLRRDYNMGVIFVTHDLSVVQEHASHICVLYAGRPVEWGKAKAFFEHPRHPYSEALLGSVARLGQARLQNIPGNLPEPETRPPGCRFEPRCSYAKPDCAKAYPAADQQGNGTVAACLHPLTEVKTPHYDASLVERASKHFKPLLELEHVTVRYPGASGWFGGATKLPPSLADITLTLGRGECLGVVGESGSGKTTFGRAVLQMLDYEGRMSLDGKPLTHVSRAVKREMRRKIQVVFQDPRESMNPRLTIGDVIAEPMVLRGGMSRADIQRGVEDLLGQVGLNAEIARLHPGAISGGQAQRVAIARALAVAPEMIVLDEPTSALDVSTQAMLLNLLKDLAKAHNLSYVLISHDFAVVSYMADRIAVLNAGHIVEMNETPRLISNPQHSYTKALIGAAPQLQPLPV